MNKKERLLSVLNHEKPDRIPVGLWFHFEGEQANGQACVQAHLDYYRATDIDFIKIMSDNLGYPLRVSINCAEDWFKVKSLPQDDPFFIDSVERCAEINKALDGECYTFYNFFSPFNIIRAYDVITPKELNGRDNNAVVQAHLRENGTAVQHALNVIAEDLALLAHRVISEGGCLGVYQSLQGAEKGYLTPEEYATIVSPSDRIVIDAFNGISSYNMLHLCSWAGHPNNLSYWKDYPSCVKNWGIGIENVSLLQGKQLFGSDTVLLGGLDNRPDHPLYSGTKEQVQETVHAVLDEMKNVPFILGADCTVPNTIDLERIRWVMEVVKAHQ